MEGLVQLTAVVEVTSGPAKISTASQCLDLEENCEQPEI